MQRLMIVVLALAAAACATPSTPDSSTAQKSNEEKEYRTGSRIPVRDPVSSSPTTTASPSAMSPTAPPRI